MGFKTDSLSSISGASLYMGCDVDLLDHSVDLATKTTGVLPFTNGGNGRFFTQTATSSGGTSTTALFTISSTGVGSLAIPANSLTQGTTIRIIGAGIITKGAGNHTVQININGVSYLATASVNSGAGTNAGWRFQAEMTVRTTGVSGTIQGQGMVWYGTANILEAMPKTTTQTIDTTSIQTISVQAQWASSNAGNLTQLTNLICELV